MKSNKKEGAEWFEEWFDSPFYHVLYKNRDIKEAHTFISNLINFLKPNVNSLFLDVACGKGRHSMYLNKLGFQVDGFDLSLNSINDAKKNETDTLKFYTNDIREPLKVNKYDYAFNLFTSFGYFDSDNDNQIAINSIAQSIKNEGIVVLDFMNCNKVINNLTKVEGKLVDNVCFNITREFTGGYIIKNICFNQDGTDYSFQEKVKAISLKDFKTYFSKANLKIEAIFGDYNLTPFNEETSDRLIIIAKK